MRAALLLSLLLFNLLGGCKIEEKEIDVNLVFAEAIQGQWYVSLVWFIDDPYRYKTTDSILYRNRTYSIYDSAICELPDINFLGNWDIRKNDNSFIIVTEELCGKTDTLNMTIHSLRCSEEMKCAETRYHITALGKFTNWVSTDYVTIELYYDKIGCLEVMLFLDFTSDPVFLLHLDRPNYVHDFSSWFWFFEDQIR